MGEISFKYKIKPEGIQEAVFKYWFSESIEYGFAYQRYVAFSDASIFNSPVAITKVAAGLSDLRDLFVKQTHHMNFYSAALGAYKDKSNTFETHNVTGNTQTKHTNYERMLAGETDIKSVSHKNGLLTKGHGKISNINDIYTVYTEGNVGDIPYWVQSAIKLYHDKVDKHKDIYGVTSDKILNKNEIHSASKILSNVLNVFENPSASPFILELYLQETDSTKKPDVNHMTQMIQPSLKPQREIYLNYLKIQSAKYKHALQMSLTDTQSLVKDLCNHTRIYPVILAEPNKYLYVSSQSILASVRPIYESAIPQNETWLKALYQKSCLVEDYMLGYKSGKESSAFNSIIRAGKSFKHSFVEKQFSIDCRQETLCGLDLEMFNIFTVKNSKKVFTIDGVPIFLDFENLGNVKWNYHWIDKNEKSCFQTCNVRLNANEVDGVTSLGMFLSKDRKTTFLNENGKFLEKVRKLSKVLYEMYFVNKNRHPVYLHNKLFRLKEANSNLKFRIQDFVMGYKKERVSFKLELPLAGYKKPRLSFGLQSHLPGYYKDDKSFKLIEQEEFVKKPPKNAVVNYKDVFVNKMLLSSDNFYTFGTPWLDKLYHDMSHLAHEFFVNKDTYFAEIFKNGQTLIKNLMSMDLPDFTSVIRNNIPATYLKELYNGFESTIIPISKIRNQAYIDKVNTTLSKLMNHMFLTESLFASKILGKMQLNLGLLCDRKEHNLLVDYMNLQITRNKLHTIINQDTVAQRKCRPLSYLFGQIWADKTIGNMWLEQEVNAFKKANNVFLKEVFGVERDKRDISIQKETGAFRIDREIGLQNSLFVDKLDRICYYDYGFTWAEKESINAQIQMQVQGHKTIKAQSLDCVSSLIKNDLKGFYDHVVFGQKFISESHLFKQISDAQGTIKHLEILPNDFGNWAWVYEEPDPFDGFKYGIDELLLPENDTRYEDLEDIIFDKENMRPKNPIKQIDDTTFVAKYPTKHPIPDYEKIGIEYIDVETSIMHTIFLKFYRIWQSKIFEFGTMTMIQSVKQMLDYMYVWIMQYFPLDQIEQALRVFRLIRWYGETSIIQNSQYIVSYEYGTLESKLTTGTCLIPNDLLTNHSMYVDASLGVIRNNTALLGIQDAYVTFEIDNRKNTTFTFSLSNTVGSVNIYVNNTLVDTVSTSALNLTYPVPYTGGINTVKIEKIASHNLNGTFYIGNIKVPNSTFKNLSVEFDPMLKAGNKPLDEIARKMIAFANLYENKQEMYEIIRKGNLGVSEIYKRLAEYWELHHQDKLKGKRLTIKET